MLSRSTLIPASALLVSFLYSPVTAQLTTSCNPTLKTCPDDPAFGTAHTFHFNSTPAEGLFNTSAGTITYDATNGANLTIPKQGYSPTLSTNFYFFWGKTEVIMKAAAGTGIISSIVWGSDDLDEVDWEFKGTDTTNVYSNYFGKGRQNDTNGGTHPVTGSVQTEWHNYTNVWNSTQLEWWLDGVLVRTLKASDANNTNNYPQTPMTLRMGIWAGGDSSQAAGTIEWAGGKTDYTQAPFTMFIQSARVEDYSTGTEYTYSDRSGSGSSIKITNPGSNSTALTVINTPPSTPDKTISEKWDELPSATKTGVYAAAGGVGAIMLIALMVYYFKQRRRGQREAALAVKAQEEERLELERFKREGRDPDALGFEGADYVAGSMAKNGVVTSAYDIPDSRSNSLRSMHDMPEKADAWDPTGSNAASAGMGAAVPLLSKQGQSTRVGSPGSQGFNSPSRNNSFSPVTSPTRTQSAGMPPSPGMPPSFPPPASPGPRSFTPGNGSVRTGSPGPQPGGYSNMDRTQSPRPMQAPTRSFSSPRNPGGYANDDGYWNGGGHR